MAENGLDNRWGFQGVALLPSSVRGALGHESLPNWVRDDLGLSVEANITALDQSIWTSKLSTLSARVRSYLVNLFNARRGELRGIQAFVDPWPYWLDPNELQYSTRTRNCLINSGLLADRGQLSKITFGKLFDIPNMGALSILEFVCVSESAFSQQSASLEANTTDAFNDLAKVIFETWADQISSTDPRFLELIPRGIDGTIYQSIVGFLGRPDEDSRSLKPLAASIPQIREHVSKIKTMPLERQLSHFLQALSRTEGPRLAALLDRFGWAGALPITLEEAGLRLGVTRERIRQLQERALGRLKVISLPVYMPALDDALQFLRIASPISIAEACKLLKTHGLSETEFHPACVISAAELLGRKAPVCLQTVGKRTIVTTTDCPNADAILNTAYRQAQASGASNIAEVIAELHSRQIVADEDTVLHVLRELSDVEFFEDQWFCRRPQNPDRDRLKNVTRKMLSVTAPIELGEVREGLRREYRYKGHRGLNTWALIVPPRAILRKYYLAHPEFTIDEHDLVKSVDPLDYRTELSLNDAILVDVLRLSPACVLDRASLWTECARRSMNINTFSIYLTYSPTIVHLGTDIWSLRGVKVDPAAVEAVRSANALRPKEKRVLDHGWTADGQLWVATRLPIAHPANLVFGIPGSIKRYLSGRQFAIKDDDGVIYGMVRINDEGSSYGFGPFLRQRGADEGDILIAEFDLNGGEVLLRLADDELLDELSPET